jgi:rhodanese-related sulfurtransferase
MRTSNRRHLVLAPCVFDRHFFWQFPFTNHLVQDAYLIDVREQDEAIQGSIPSSVNLPLSVLSNALHLDPNVFKATYGFEKPRKNQEIIFYCRTGKRSATASDVAKRNGYTKFVTIYSSVTQSLIDITVSITMSARGWIGLTKRVRQNHDCSLPRVWNADTPSPYSVLIPRIRLNCDKARH